jgi:hypothetical protein
VSFPVPQFERGLGNTIRPVEWEIKNPYVHIFNLNLQRELPYDFVVTLGYAGTRGIHLLRSGDVNIPTPTRLADGTYFFPANAATLRPNPAFTTIELKRADGDSWYNAMIFEGSQAVHTRRNAAVVVYFSRATSTTPRRRPSFRTPPTARRLRFRLCPDLTTTKGLSDYHAKHNWVFNFVWELPFGKGMSGASEKLLGGWQLMGIAQMRSGNPLDRVLFSVIVRAHMGAFTWTGAGIRSSSPGTRQNSGVSGYGNPEKYFDRLHSSCNRWNCGYSGRGALIGPNLRTFDLSLLKNTRIGEALNIQFRVEAFNLFNRANFGKSESACVHGRARCGHRSADLVVWLDSLDSDVGETNSTWPATGLLSKFEWRLASGGRMNLNVQELLNEQLSGDAMQQLSQQIGADPESTGNAVNAALPMLLGGMARNTQSEGGASSLLGALDRDHDGSVLDDVVGFLGQGGNGSGDGILVTSSDLTGRTLRRESARRVG